MADFNITVDTRPMADSIDSVNGHVQNVTVAVTAMQAAVISAEREASGKICHNVDSGFYMLMRSQLSQKIAAVASQMYSKMQLMESFKKDIERIMVVMQDDYERIKRRYLKHFDSLDSALETRIHELDKKAYEIRKNRNQSLFKKGSDVVKTIIYNDETQMVNVQEVGATVKNKSVRSIGTMADDVVQTLSYNKTVRHILKDSDIDRDTEEYVPVIVAETDSMFSADSSVNSVFAPEGALRENSKLVNQVQSSAQEFSWKDVDDETFDHVKSSFMSRFNTDQVDDRIAKEMVRLFEASKWNVTEGEE